MQAVPKRSAFNGGISGYSLSDFAMHEYIWKRCSNPMNERKECQCAARAKIRKVNYQYRNSHYKSMENIPECGPPSFCSKELFAFIISPPITKSFNEWS